MILGINKGKERGGSLGASPLACDTMTLQGGLPVLVRVK